MDFRRKHLFLPIFLISVLLSLYLIIDKHLLTVFNKVSYEENKSVVKQNHFIMPSNHVQPASGVWTIEPCGRLGNLMGEYATLYALAKINGHRAYIQPYMYTNLSRLFKIQLPVLLKKDAERIKWKRYTLKNWMLPEYKMISGDYVQLLGTPYSWTFFHHIKDEILQEFTFHDYVKREANEYLAKVQGGRQNVTFIGVHVRRGDYVQIMPKERKGVVADKGYLDKAMTYFRDKYANPIFVVTSNGMAWCKENINNSMGDVHFAGNGNEGSPFRDFALLAHCNHTIMTVGSFGIWASYLTGGETIYLLNYTLPNSPYLQYFKYDAVYLPSWIGIPADLSPLLQTGKNKTGIKSK